MNVLGRIFVSIGKGVAAIFKTAEQRGLTDELVKEAEDLVVVAQNTFKDNDRRREWAIAALIAATNGRVPESLIRLAIELGVQSFKSAQTPKQ